MEVPSIHNQANHQLEQATSFRRSMHDLKREIKAAKLEQKSHAFRGMRFLISSTVSIDNSRSGEAVRELSVARRLRFVTREREHRASSFEKKLRSAVGKAHVLIDLARRARGGHIYAKHQADTMLDRKT